MKISALRRLIYGRMGCSVVDSDRYRCVNLEELAENELTCHRTANSSHTATELRSDCDQFFLSGTACVRRYEGVKPISPVRSRTSEMYSEAGQQRFGRTGHTIPAIAVL